jgi:ferredoxin
MQCVFCHHEIRDGLCPIVNGTPQIEQSACSTCYGMVASGVDRPTIIELINFSECEE